MMISSGYAQVGWYLIQSDRNGRLRRATRVCLPDGTVIRFDGRFKSDREAVKQAVLAQVEKLRADLYYVGRS